MGHFIVSFRVSILSIFILLFFLFVASLLAITSYRFSVVTSYTAFNLMGKASDIVFDKISDQMNRAQSLAELSADLLESNIVNQKNLESVSQYTYHIMNRERKFRSPIEGAYWADEQGNFVYSQRLKDGKIKSEITDRRKQIPSDISYYYDKNNNLINKIESKDPNNLTYDAHSKEWYKDALSHKVASWSEVYQYLDSDLLGMSVLTPGFAKNGSAQGVFGLDLQVDFLKEFVEKIDVSKNGIAFLANEKSQIVAFPKFISHKNSKLIDIHEAPFPWVTTSFEKYRKENISQFSFYSGGYEYLAVYKRLSRPPSRDLILGVIAPKNDFLGDLNQIFIITLITSGIVFLIGVFLTSYWVSLIVKPLSRLTDDIAKIKNFELDSALAIQSHIHEIVSISENVQAMKEGLKSFQKYVPASLVRQLIASGESAQIGGGKKNIAIFFSDIVNFTTIAEKSDPAVLTKQLCEYFELMSKIITKHQGTIDKYIGDSIMAFWGAPVPQEQALVYAASAALECKQELEKFNQEHAKKNEIVFQTCIGIHAGDAIVGNIGSSERINYTAIGDVVNHASRLENVNRSYNTDLMVSSDVYEKLKKEFVFRKIDRVALKGRDQEDTIYQLICRISEEAPFPVQEYQNEFSNAFSFYEKAMWQKALASFQKCKFIFPNDTVSVVFIKRCEKYLQQGTPDQWRGVWHY